MPNSTPWRQGKTDPTELFDRNDQYVGKMQTADEAAWAVKQANDWDPSGIGVTFGPSQQVDQEAVVDPRLRKIADQPRATWITGPSPSLWQDVRDTVSGARNGLAPVYTLYAIPSRDAGAGYSAGGVSAQTYPSLVGTFADAVADHAALVVVEPDALGHANDLGKSQRAERLQLINNAVSRLKRQPNVRVYIDASMWVAPKTMTGLLKAAGIAQADGFSLNVSNFKTDAEVFSYGEQLSKLVGRGYVYDSSRNGRGSNGEWCNPTGRGLGLPPGYVKDKRAPHCDGRLWVKSPGRSDGECNGGPKAGVFWKDYALGLVDRAAF